MNLFNDLKNIINTPDDDSLYSNVNKPKSTKVTLKSTYEVIVYKPVNFEESTNIAQSILAGNIAIVDLSTTDHSIARRIIDFLSGTTFERNIQIKRLSNLSFLFAFNSILIDDNFIDLLKDLRIEF